MIKLYELRSDKLPCYTSIFFKLEEYNKNLFDILIQTKNSSFNQTKHLFEFPINKLAFIVNLLKKYDDVQFIPYKEAVKNSISSDKIKFKIKPYKHQIQGIDFGLNHDGWLLLDDQGLGKTLQMIYLAQSLKQIEKLEHCLIICGDNNLKCNWQNEILDKSKLSCKILGQKISKNGKIRYSSIPKRAEELKEKISEFFVITNIESFQSTDLVNAFKKSKNKFDLIILDEAHKITNPGSKTGKNLLKLKAKRKIALSGTLIKTNPHNAYLPLKWTNCINSNFGTFKSMYTVFGGFGNVQIVGYQNLDLLQNLINKCSLRRLKDEVVDLPEKIYQNVFVEMDSAQQTLYDEVEKGILTELDKLDHKPTVIEEITINTRLRQITAFPGILSSTVINSAKLDKLEDYIEQITAQGDKVLVFNTFRNAAYEEYNRLSRFSPVLCTGGQTESEIQFNKKQFMDNPDTKVMIATWQKMGVGHTLTSASYVIFVDTPWTNADFQQAVDRIHRIGQNKRCFIISLITKNTYDERVLELLNISADLSNYLIDNKQLSEKINIFQE